MEAFLDTILGIVWHRYVAYILVLFGAYATIRLGFLQIVHIPTMFKLLAHGKKSNNGVSSLQSFLISVGGRVGTGNISGVAAAIIIGGPGAILWMWVAAFVGCASSFVESVMGQLYKTTHNSERCAGMALCAEKLFNRFTNTTALGRVLCVIIATVAGLATNLTIGPQANALSQAYAISWGFPGWLSGLLISAVFLIVVVGGVRRIVRVTEAVVPIMGAIFVFAGMLLIALNASAVPSTFVLIWDSAANPHAALGGFAGVFLQGVIRGVYSNEAGNGSLGPHIGGIAETRHPAEQGFVQALAVYVDTMVVCTTTALILLMTDSYNLFSSDGGALFTGVAGLGQDNTMNYVYIAFNRGLIDGFSKIVMPIILTLFVITTIVSCYFISEINANILDSKMPQAQVFGRSWLIRAAQTLGTALIFYSSVTGAAVVWKIADVGVGTLVVINIALMILGFPYVLRVYKDYNNQIKSGVKITDIKFNPRSIGIHDADFWNDEVRGV